MKTLTMFAMVAAPVLASAQPVSAADLGDSGGSAIHRQGAFAGARLRVPLGGGTDSKVHAGLSVAPILESRGSDGSLRTRFGEGVELGLAGKEKAGLRIGGRSLAQLTEGREAPEGRKAGVSTLKGLAIVGGIVVLTLGALTLLLVAQE